MANEGIPVSKQAHEGNVKELQTYLREISMSYPQVRAIFPDGVYGEDTAAAVADFQRLRGLPETGEADKATWDAVLDVYYDIISNLADQVGIRPLPSVNIVLSSGDSGTAIIILQAMLNTLAGLYFNIPASALSGVYDNDTANAVKAFQETAGLSPTGDADIRTWNALAGLFNATVVTEYGEI